MEGSRRICYRHSVINQSYSITADDRPVSYGSQAMYETPNHEPQKRCMERVTTWGRPDHVCAVASQNNTGEVQNMGPILAPAGKRCAA
jgi:hypothetical protein